MKRLLVILILFFICDLAKGQDTLKKVYIPNIGFSFYVPANYEITKPVPKHHYDDDPVLVISDTDKNNKSSMRISVSLTKVSDSTTKLFNNMIPYMKYSLAVAHTSDKNLHIDTLFTKVKIGSLLTDKIILEGDEYELGYRSTSSYLGQYNNYYFNIGVHTDDKNLRNKIHSLIEAGKFDN